MDNHSSNQTLSKDFHSLVKKARRNKLSGFGYNITTRNKKILLLTLAVIAVVVVASRLTAKQVTIAAQAAPVLSGSQIEVNQRYELPATSTNQLAAGVATMSMTIISAKKVNQVSVNNQAIKAPEGQAFLLLDLELQNNNATDLGFFARDYVRLVVNDKPFAPEFYNKDVVVAPVSVLQDKVSFLVDASQENYQLRVGQLQNPSDQLTLTFD